MTYPAWPFLTIWGFTKQSVQLLITPVVGICLLKKKFSSLLALSVESLPWTAFLVPSVPKTALNELGASLFATSELVGPMNYLQPEMAPLLMSSMPTQTSLVMKLWRFGKNGFSVCSA